MFCKNCGKQIEDGVKFCPECGTANEPAGASAKQGGSDAGGSVNKKTDPVSDTVEKTNPLCIAGLVLTILTLFVNTYGLVGFAAIIISFFGYKEAKKNGQKGTMLAIVCMAVAGIISLILIVCLVEYQKYEFAVQGGISGFLEWLEDL